MTDGTARIALLAHVDQEHAVEWTRPQDILVEPESDIRQFFERNPGQIIVALADGSIQRFRADIEDEVWRNLMTIDSGEVVDIDELQWIRAFDEMPVWPDPIPPADTRPDRDGGDR